MGGIDVGFIAYPCSIEKHELEAIGGPLSIVFAETDPTFPIGTRYKTRTILSEIAGRPFQITLYGHVAHGFMHYDPDEDAAQYARESSFAQALQWFERHLKDSRNVILQQYISWNIQLSRQVKRIVLVYGILKGN